MSGFTLEHFAGAALLSDLGPEARRFRPMPDRLLVLPGKTKTMTEGGLHIPDTSVKRAQTATVVAVGRNVEYLEPGMTVYVSYWSAAEITLDNTEYRLYCTKDVGGFLDPTS